MSVNVNMPFQVTIDAKGNVVIEKIETTTYSLDDPAKQFGGFLRDDILDAFTVFRNVDSEVANVTVDMKSTKSTAFANELAKQLYLAFDEELGLTSAQINNLAMYLLSVANEYILATLTDGAGSSLEADGLKELRLTDICGSYLTGARTMYSGLDALEPNVRALVALQIPNSKWMSAWSPSDLPLKNGGDSMTFQFNITQNYSVSAVNKDLGAGIDGAGESVSTGTNISRTVGNVPAKIVHLVLTRAAPASYKTLSAPSAPSSSAVTTATALVSTKSGLYNSAKTAASTALATFKAKDSAHLNRVRADQEVVDAQTSLDTATTLLNDADSALKKAVSDGITGSDLDNYNEAFNQAQAGVSAASSSKANAEALAATARTNDGGVDTEVAAAAVESAKTAAATASDAVRTAYDAWVAAKSGLSDAVAQYDRDVELFNYRTEELAAAKESANDKRDHQFAMWSDASANAITAIALVESDRSDLNTKDGDKQAKEIAMNAEVVGSEAAQTAANLWNTAINDYNTAKAKFDEDLAAAKEKVTAVNALKAPYEAALANADAAPAQSDVVVAFSNPAEYVYTA